MSIQSGPPAVFLDRDGTINREVDYLSSAEEFEWLPGAKEALLRLQGAGFALVVVTNQSGIARGMLDEKALAAIHWRMKDEFAAAGGKFDWIGYCPHHPTVGEAPYRAQCACRKPQPGMMLQAAAELGLNLRESYCIGDSKRDLQAAAQLGVPGYLVRTGKGASQEASAMASIPGLRVVDDLAQASRVLVPTIH